MSKKHFIALADVMRGLRPNPVENEPPVTASDIARLGRLNQWKETCAALAAFCRAQNGNFNTARWFGYIDGANGPNGGKVATNG